MIDHGDTKAKSTSAVSRFLGLDNVNSAPEYRASPLKWAIVKGFERGNDPEQMTQVIDTLLSLTMTGVSGLGNDLEMGKSDGKLVVLLHGGHPTLSLREIGDKVVKNTVNTWLSHIATTATPADADHFDIDTISIVFYEENEQGDLIDAWLLKDIAPRYLSTPNQPHEVAGTELGEHYDGGTFDYELRFNDAPAIRGNDAILAANNARSSVAEKSLSV